ncbi:hypothetical protein [Streptomyces sp. NBC_01314]|uniref:hypothetical protein n=1 Tax=Streptomyces sp. NBC_01314 TaxID=2903821 RepID=UPI0030881DB6|nr:hypothetical protein OG622_02960 [Streptomyces sp. NBC_01314]
MPQAPALLPWLTPRKDVALPAGINQSVGRLRDRRRGADRVSATGDPDEPLTPVGFSDYAGKYPGELSRGMRQRWPSSAPPAAA